jgi:hypothetical protein
MNGLGTLLYALMAGRPIVTSLQAQVRHAERKKILRKFRPPTGLDMQLILKEKKSIFLSQYFYHYEVKVTRCSYAEHAMEIKLYTSYT